MFSPSVVNILLQSLAAIVICVVGYLALLLCALAGLLLAKLIYTGARFLCSRVFSTAVSANGAPAKVGGRPCIVPYN